MILAGAGGKGDIMRISRQRKKEILAILGHCYAGTATALEYNSPFEFLVAVILSAQCTDKRVNIVTGRLFPRYGTPEKMRELGQERLEPLIRDCGLYHSKAKNIIAASEILCRRYKGEVPADFKELITLPGVGRKSANVVLSQAYGIPALAVDTHVFRVANRLGLAPGKTPLAVESGLKRVIPQSDWTNAHHWLIWHGRKICRARRPDCPNCPLRNLCPSRTSGENQPDFKNK